MKDIGKASVLGVLLLFGAGCADLEVTNPNAADAERAIQTAGDLESLVAGSFRQWWLGNVQNDGVSFILSNMSWQHSQWPANFGTVFYSSLPRPATVNDPADQFYGNITYAWNQHYKALAAIASGLRAIDASQEVQDELGAEHLQRIRAYGKFVQGLAHGSIALLYDQGFQVDETIDLVDASGTPIPQEPLAYGDLMAKALEYFDEAAALSAGQSFATEPGWMSVAVSADDLARIAKSMRARYAAAVARTPDERAAVDWQAVSDDIDAGIQSAWLLDMPHFGSPFWHEILNYMPYSAWQQLSYQVVGMADTSGTYQKWLAIEPTSRMPDVDDAPFLIMTSDTRFAQGATLEEQEDQPGSLYAVPTYALANNWKQPARGTYRWSYYRSKAGDANQAGEDMVPEITMEEMNLLKAEALYRLNGNVMTAEAAALVNQTRTAAGLDDISDGNDSCVPKLPSGDCGDFFEALKWEKRLHTQFLGLYGAPWYFEGRGWGDLYRGTPLQFPVPCKEQQIFGNPCENFGGVGGNMAAPTSVYSWPFEG